MDDLFADFDDEIDGDDDEDILCKCTSCGYEMMVPGFVLDEFAGYERFIGKKNVIPNGSCFAKRPI